MAVIVYLPADVENKLRAESADWESEAKEAMLVELFRQGKLSRHELSLALGLSRAEIDGLLKRHNVTEDLPTLDELEDDFRVARSLLEQ